MAYISLVRSGLEYASSIWDPQTAVLKKELENIQNRAIRWIFDKSPRERVSVTRLRKEIPLHTLEQRRLHSRLCLFYKIVNGEVVVTSADVGLALSVDRTHIHKRHEQTYRHILFKGGGSTIPRTVPAWNKLPRALVQASSTDTFKSGLEALCP